MSTSERTLNQVRAILNKLDRSIDEARERRTHPPTPAAAAPQPPAPPPQQQAQPTPPAPSQPARAGSAYGRAQPIQRPQASSLNRWTS